MPSHSRQIFLSYARRDGEPLAKKLKPDLEAAGYGLWQDRDDILGGEDFMDAIVAGVHQSRLMIAVLSPRSVRKSVDPDNDSRIDSVCLDEIACARFDANIPIIPVMAVPCAVPGELTRLHYIDMTGWRNPDEYRIRREELCRAVQRALTTGQVAYRTWLSGLRPLEFDNYLHEKRRQFTGRKWLFQEISQWLDSTGEQALLIKGDPGIGKSAVMAELVHANFDGRLLGYHFCRADDIETLRPDLFVRSLAATLAARLPDYHDHLADNDELDNLLCGGGLNKNPMGGFERAILTPLHQIPSPKDKKTRYLLVDALDEALTLPEKPTIVELLADRLQQFPNWLRLIVAARKDERTERPLAGLHAAELEARSEDNLGDLEDYINLRLGETEFVERLAETGAPADVAARQLAEKAEGSFLYVKEVLRGVAHGSHSFDAMDRLPPGLVGLYDHFFRRHFDEPDPFVSGPPQGERDYRWAEPLLATIVAAQEPLATDELIAACQLHPKAARAQLVRLSGYLPERSDGRLAPWHRSFVEWLCDQKGPFAIDVQSGHQRLAKQGVGQFARGTNNLSNYQFRHLAAHLLEIEGWDDLVSLLTNPLFIKAKAARGEIHSLIRDFDRTLARLPQDHPRRSDAATLYRAIDTNAHIRDPKTLLQQIVNQYNWDETSFQDAFRKFEHDMDRPWLRLRHRASPAETPLLRILADHNDRVQRLAFSPDGRILFSAGADGKICLWDVQTGSLTRHFQSKSADGKNTSATFSSLVVAPDGACFASLRRRVFRFDLTTGDASLFRTFESTVRSLTLSPNGNELAISLWDKAICIRGRISGKSLWQLDGFSYVVEHLAFSPDGKTLACVDNGKIRLWNTTTQQEQQTFATASSAIAFAPNSHFLASIDYVRHSIDIWDVGTGEKRHTLEGHPESSFGVTSLGWSPDGALLASGGHDNTIRLWDIAKGKRVSTLHGHRHIVYDVAFAPDGKTLASGGADQTVRLWDTETAVHMLGSPAGHKEEIISTAISPPTDIVASGSSDGRICLWEIPTGKLLRALEGHSNWVTVLTFTTDGRYLISSNRDATVRVWETATGACLHLLEGHVGYVNRLALSPDETLIASGCNDCTVRLWDMKSGRLLHILDGHPTSVVGVVFDPSGKFVASWCHDNTVRLWDPYQGALLRNLEGHRDEVRNVAFTGDGRILISGSEDKTICLWEIDSGKLLHTLAQPEKVNALTSSPDGSLVACSCYHSDRDAGRLGPIQVWDVESGTLRFSLEGHTDWIGNLVCSPDGTLLVSTSIAGGSDSTLRVWDLTSGEALAWFPAEDIVKTLQFHPGSSSLLYAVDRGGSRRRPRVYKLELLS